MTEFADLIKERVSCKEFAEFMGLTVNRSGFAVCPFHGDKDASLKIYKNDRGWCCFGCHKGGDVINMASLYYNLPFKDTIKRLNEDFSLGLALEAPQDAPERLVLAVQRARRKSAQAKEQRLREAIEREYWRRFDLWLDNERSIEVNEPKSRDEEWNEAFVSALRKRDVLRYELELATERRDSLYAHE